MKTLATKIIFNTLAISLFIASLIATTSLAWQVHLIDTPADETSGVVPDPPEAIHTDIDPHLEIEKVNVKFEVGSTTAGVPTSYYEFPPHYVTVGARCDLPEYRKN